MNKAKAVWLATAVAVIGVLLVADSTRTGPAVTLTRCNYAIADSDEPAADVLVMGSSRTGFAFDPVAMTGMFQAANRDIDVDRIVFAGSPLRVNAAVLDNYLNNRGNPDVVVFEVNFLTQRTVDRIEVQALDVPEDFLYRRDVNLMNYRQILTTNAVARPFSAPSESIVNKTRLTVEGMALRSGALAYELFTKPTGFDAADICDKEALTRDDRWRDGFAFALDEIANPVTPAEHIDQIRQEIRTADKPLAEWQQDVETGIIADFDVDADYRQGEVALLEQAVERAAENQIPVVLVPLALYGTVLDPNDIRLLEDQFAGKATVFDAYAETEVDLSAYWLDDAHLEIGPATTLTTAILAQHLTDENLAR